MTDNDLGPASLLVHSWAEGHSKQAAETGRVTHAHAALGGVLMLQSWRLGRIAGVEIGLHWTVLGIALLLAFGLGGSVLPAAAPGYPGFVYGTWAVLSAILFLFCLLGHELAHVLVARRFGVTARRITLWLLGGVSELDGEAPTPRAELFIAGAGPLSSLAFGGISAGLAYGVGALGGPGVVVVSLAWLAAVNVLLGVFNLLPGAPLDGGRVLRAVLWRIRGDRDRAQIAADWAGVGLGVALGALGLVELVYVRGFGGVWLILLGWFLVVAANADRTRVRVTGALAGRSVRDIMSGGVVYGNVTESAGQFLDRVVAGSRHHAFPLVDLDGRVVGLVRRADLFRLTPAQRAMGRLADVSARADPVGVVPVDTAAVDAVKALGPASPLVCVTDGGRLVGVVSAADVSHAVELSSASRPQAFHPG
jgi:Zn-dependent protease